MKHYLRLEAWVHRAPSVAVIAAVVIVLIGWGMGLPLRFSVVKMAKASQPLVNDEGAMPDLDGAVGWLNSTPLSGKSLRGKVVLVNFWP